MRFCFLINTRSGGGAGDRILNDILTLIDRKVIEGAAYPLSHELPLEDILRRDTFDRVVVGGGDGSVSWVVTRLVGAETPVGVLPIGTSNDLGREFGLVEQYSTVSLRSYLDILADAEIKPLTVWQVSYGRDFGQSVRFCNYLSIGIDGQIIRSVEKVRRRLGRSRVSSVFLTRFLYGALGLWNVFYSGYRQGKLIGDGEVLVDLAGQKTVSILFCNIESVMGMGRAHPESSGLDGKIEVIHFSSPFQYLALLAKRLLPGLTPASFAGRESWQVDGVDPNQPLQADGEYLPQVAGSKYRIERAGQVRVLVAN